MSSGKDTDYAESKEGPEEANDGSWMSVADGIASNLKDGTPAHNRAAKKRKLPDGDVCFVESCKLSFLCGGPHDGVWSKALRAKHYRTHKEEYESLPFVSDLPKKVYKCTVDTVHSCGVSGCGEEFSTEALLDIHIGVKKYVCSNTGCDYAGTTKHNLHAHEKTCKKGSSAPNRRFYSAVEHADTIPKAVAKPSIHVIKPEARRSLSDPDKFVCHFCPEDSKHEWAKLGSLHSHWKKHHPLEWNSFKPRAGSSVVTYTCDESSNPGCKCGLVFNHKQKWEAHLGARTHFCRNGCGVSFTNSSDEGHHAKFSCVTNEGAFHCEIDDCQRVCKTLGALQQHQSGPVHAKVSKPHMCEECARGFQYYSAMKFHAHTVHKDARPFVCAEVMPDGSVCGQGFKTNGDLKKHAGVHVVTYDLPCSVCEKLHKTPRLRAAHERSVHGSHQFKCTVCEQQFRVKVVRDQHQLVHSDEKTYACTLCDGVFRQLSVLQNHVVYRHSHSRQYECECSLVFFAPFRLKAHAKVHAEGYEHGKSLGERELYRIFISACTPGNTFQAEVSPLNMRYKFDFFFNGVFVEYDGVYHYLPNRGEPPYTSEALLRFAIQVSADINKSRYCRQAGTPLLRLTGTLPSAEEVLSMVALAPVAPHDFSDYVLGRTMVSPLADFFRAVIVDSESQDQNRIWEAAALIASVTVLGSAPFHEDMDFFQLYPAVFCTFLREHELCAPTEIADLYGNEMIEACVLVASFMPEFAVPDGSVYEPVPLVFTHGPVLCPRDRFITCWLCSIQWTTSPSSADALLRHLNHAHGNPFPVKCAWCTGVFKCHKDREQIGGDGHEVTCTRADAATRGHRLRVSACPTCMVTFSERHLFYRHLNEVHYGRFPASCTYRCPACKQGFKSLPELERHVCPV
jgi:hypothetical protein